MTAPDSLSEAARLLGHSRSATPGSAVDMALSMEAQARATVAVAELLAILVRRQVDQPAQPSTGTVGDWPLAGDVDQQGEWPLWTVVQGQSPGDDCHCVWANNGIPAVQWITIRAGADCQAHGVGCQYGRDDLPAGLVVLGRPHHGGTA